MILLYDYSQVIKPNATDSRRYSFQYGLEYTGKTGFETGHL